MCDFRPREDVRQSHSYYSALTEVFMLCRELRGL